MSLHIFLPLSCQSTVLSSLVIKAKIKEEKKKKEGQWEMGQIHVDDMTWETVSTDVHDIRAKSVGAVSKNVFSKYYNVPHLDFK